MIINDLSVNPNWQSMLRIEEILKVILIKTFFLRCKAFINKLTYESQSTV